MKSRLIDVYNFDSRKSLPFNEIAVGAGLSCPWGPHPTLRHNSERDICPRARARTAGSATSALLNIEYASKHMLCLTLPDDQRMLILYLKLVSVGIAASVSGEPKCKVLTSVN